MKKFTQFIHKHLKKVIFILALLLMSTIGGPLLINWLYKQPAQISLFRTEWQASDTLSYFGSVLTFLGTSALSALALWQNHQIKTANDKHTALLENMEKAKNKVRLKVSECVALADRSSLTLSIINITENIGHDFEASHFKIASSANSDHAYWESEKIFTCDYLSSFMEWKIELDNPEIPQGDYFTFEITCSDEFGENCKYRIVGHFNNGKPPKLNFETVEA